MEIGINLFLLNLFSFSSLWLQFYHMHLIFPYLSLKTVMYDVTN